MVILQSNGVKIHFTTIKLGKFIKKLVEKNRVYLKLLFFEKPLIKKITEVIWFIVQHVKFNYFIDLENEIVL